MICCYLPGFSIGTKLHCLVTEAHGCEQLAHSRYAAAPDRGANPRPLDRKSDALPLRHHATWKIVYLRKYSFIQSYYANALKCERLRPAGAK